MGAALFGVAHVLMGVRYVGTPRNVERTTLAIVGTSAILGLGIWFLPAGMFVRLSLALIPVAAGAEMVRQLRGRAGKIAAVAASLGCVTLCWNTPVHASAFIAQAHGFGSIVFAAVSAKSSRLNLAWLWMSALVVIGAVLSGMLDGFCLRATEALSSYPEIQNELANATAGATSSRWIGRWLVVFAFTQSLHYSIWLRIMPELERRASVPQGFKRAWKDFRSTFGVWSVWIVPASLALTLCMLFGGAPAREAYFGLTTFHIALEAAGLARRVVNEGGPFAARGQGGFRR